MIGIGLGVYCTIIIDRGMPLLITKAFTAIIILMRVLDCFPNDD